MSGMNEIRRQIPGVVDALVATYDRHGATSHALSGRPLPDRQAVILLIKLTLLLSLKAIWFNEPTVPEDGQQRVEHHLFGQPAPLSIHTEESPR